MIHFGIRTQIKRQMASRRHRGIYAKFRDYTMISSQTFCDNLSLAAMVRDLDGCIVECGVWRGGMTAGICRVLGSHRRYFLFDSFEGLPPAQPIDGPAAINWQKDTSSLSYYDNCRAPPEFAQRAMERAGATQFHLVPGFFDATLPTFKAPQPIALLRLDADWYESTMTCLTHLFDQVAPKGIVILDDYYTWDGCSRALHDFLSARQAPERVRSFNGSICYLVKTDASP